MVSINTTTPQNNATRITDNSSTATDNNTLLARQLLNQKNVSTIINQRCRDLAQNNPDTDLRAAIARDLPNILTQAHFDPSAYSPRCQLTQGYGKDLLYHSENHEEPFCLQVFTFEPEQETPIHDHPCECASLVWSGEIVESAYDPVGTEPLAVKVSETHREAGSQAVLTPEKRNIHSLRNMTDHRTTTVHLYNMDGVTQTSAVKQVFSPAPQKNFLNELLQHSRSRHTSAEDHTVNETHTNETHNNEAHNNEAYSHERSIENTHTFNTDSPVISLKLPQNASENLSAALTDNLPPLTDQEAFISHAKQTIAQMLPPSMLASVEKFGQGQGDALFITGLPTDPDLPETPENGAMSPKKRTSISEALLLGIASHMGETYGYTKEKAGALIHTVAPQPNKETSQSNAGSSVVLDFHTETAYLNTRPDFLGLICLRSDPEAQAATTFITAREIQRQLPDEAVKMLSEPLYEIRVGESFKEAQDDVRWSPPRPVFKLDSNNPDALIYQIAMRVTDQCPPEKRAKAQEALDKLLSILKPDGPITRQVILKPGEALFINNHRAVHGRTSMQAHFDATDPLKGKNRWLERVFARHQSPTADLRATANNPRILNVTMENDFVQTHA